MKDKLTIRIQRCSTSSSLNSHNKKKSLDCDDRPNIILCSPPCLSVQKIVQQNIYLHHTKVASVRSYAKAKTAKDYLEKMNNLYFILAKIPFIRRKFFNSSKFSGVIALYYNNQ